MPKNFLTARTVLGSLAFCLTVTLAFLLSTHSDAQIARNDTDRQLAPLTGAISGRVFQDFNQNGLYDTSGGTSAAPTAVDAGIAGVTVTLYDAGGTARGSATSAVDGTYSIASAGTGPYRVEFTTIPTGYSASARSRASGSGNAALPTSTTNAGATVQFVPNGANANVNLALTRSADYCEDNPSLTSQLYHYGSEAAPNAIFSFPYQSGSTRTTGGAPVDDFTAPAGTNLATTTQVGTTFGLAYHRASRRVFAAAFMKKHSQFGPAGTGAIYQVDRASGTVSTFVDLNAVFGANTAGANPHDTSDYDFDNGVATWRAVGKVAFGGIALNGDESYLFAMNLADRRLYRIPTSGPLNGTTIQSVAFPTSMGSGQEVCGSADDIRPFAVSYYDGLIYVGAVCSNESRSGQNNADARRNAYVYTVDPVALTFNATPAVDELSLNYTRAQADPGYSANWNNWRADFTNIGNQTSHVIYPQAMLTDIDFDRGNMILSFRDRVGEQSGYFAASDPSDAGDHNRKGITAGEILRLCGGPTNGWTPENNGSCGGTTTAGANNGEGIGGGEFYYQENYHPNGNPHDEVGLGSAAQIPGHNEMVAGIFDPPYLPNDNIYDAGGFRWFRNTGASAGSQNRGYMVYQAETANFGKANGIGNVAPLCEAAPIELGNRVWRDSNNNGVQDPGEPGIAGVQVHLYDANNVLVGTAVTDANGEYYFVSSTVADPNQTDNIGQVNGGIKFNSNYTIKLDRPADYNTGGPLFGLRKTVLDQTTQNGFDEGSDSDGEYDSSGNFLEIQLTTGNPGDNNHNYDFGFVLAPSAAPVSVTGRITTANGNGIRNVRVTLTEESGAMHYALSSTFGYYTFENIESGQGVVVSVSAKRYTFSPPSRFISLDDNITDADWTANP